MEMMDSYIQRANDVDAWALTREAILENSSANRTFPQYIERAKGPYIWDTTGKQYVDMNMGYGPVVIGHADSRIDNAVFEQMNKGICYSPAWNLKQVELNELLVDTIPSAEMAFLMKTGSDATTAAIRLARIFTGRSKILRWGYHGWHDWAAPRKEGIPSCVTRDVSSFSYNDLSSLEETFANFPEEIACVIMMPYELEKPSQGFLNSVRELAHKNGAIFILDEMRSGFRVSLGGAQEYFGVDPDLSTFSKAMANGYAISALVGKKEIMSEMRKTHMSSTYFGNSPEMAAAIATINIIRNEGVCDSLWEKGRYFSDSFRKILEKLNFPAKIVGYPVSPFLQFDNSPNYELVKQKLFENMIKCGVFIHPNHQWFLSSAHTVSDLDFVIEAFAESARFSLGYYDE